MTFTARLRRNGRIWTAWRHRHAVGGEVVGVPFRWVPNGDYVTDALNEGQVAALRGEPEALLEAFGTVAATPVAAPATASADDDDDDKPETPQESAERVAQRIPHTPGWRKRLREAQGRSG